MQIGNVRLKKDQYGNDSPLFNVTPAECYVYTHEKHGFTPLAGRFPLHGLVITGEAWKEQYDIDDQVFVKGTGPRTKKEELARLCRKFRADTMKELFNVGSAGAEDKLPERFDQIDGWGEADVAVIKAAAPKETKPVVDPVKK